MSRIPSLVSHSSDSFLLSTKHISIEWISLLAARATLPTLWLLCKSDEFFFLRKIHITTQWTRHIFKFERNLHLFSTLNLIILVLAIAFDRQNCYAQHPARRPHTIFVCDGPFFHSNHSNVGARMRRRISVDSWLWCNSFDSCGVCCAIMLACHSWLISFSNIKKRCEFNINLWFKRWTQSHSAWHRHTHPRFEFFEWEMRAVSARII